MKKIACVIALFGICTFCTAQKVTQLTMGVRGIEEIHLNTEKIFQLNVFSTNENVVRIETQMEGEYYRDVNVLTATHAKQLHISCQLSDTFEIPNDKLSAHKVFAITMNVYIPKHLEVQLKGDETQVYVRGSYQKFWGVLISGNYTFEDFSAEAKIQTKKGNIYCKTEKLPEFEVATLHQIIYYDNEKKVEMTADNGKITYSTPKG